MPRDELLITISNLSRCNCDEFKPESALFDILEIFSSNMLNFKINYDGSQNIFSLQCFRRSR